MVSRVMCLGKSGSFFLNSTPHHLNLPSPLLANIGYRYRAGQYAEGADERFGTIKFMDISSSNYSPEENEGLDYKTVTGRIHAISYDGTVLTDVAIASIADAIYGVWAKCRLQITGGPPLENVLEERRKRMVDACENDACRM